VNRQCKHPGDTSCPEGVNCLQAIVRLLTPNLDVNTGWTIVY